MPLSADSRPTVVFFTANPSSLSKLDLEGELESIQVELKAMDRDVLRFVHRPATTPADLQRVLLEERPRVVQFSGHGRGRTGSKDHEVRVSDTTRELIDDDALDEHLTSGIMVQDDPASAYKVVSGEALGHLFSTIGRSIDVVVLNACHSIEQADALLQHVDFVVGIDGPILDTAAKAFSVAFYRGLAFGHSLHVAFNLGVSALMLAGLDTEVRRPVLRHRNRDDPRQLTLVPARPAADGSIWDVFVSYVEKDRDAAVHLARALRDHGIRVYFDEWDPSHGDVSVLRKSDAIEDAVHGLMAVSTTSMDDKWIRQEYAALLDKAVEDNRRLIPVVIGEHDVRLPPFLRIRRPVDLRGKAGDSYQRDVEAIAAALRKPAR